MTTATVESSETATASSSAQYATFYVGDLLLGLPIHEVQEINRHLDLTPVPHAPPSIRGVINLRGDVVSVIDLPALLGLPSVEVSNKTRNVVIHYEDELVGLLVDDVADILTIRTSEIVSAPANVKGINGQFFHGVYPMEREIAVLLDLEKTIGSKH